jgi:DNA modification methylase
MQRPKLDKCIRCGSSGIASLKLGRQFVGVEIDKTYFDIAKGRISEWENQERLL